MYVDDLLGGMRGSIALLFFFLLRLGVLAEAPVGELRVPGLQLVLDLADGDRGEGCGSHRFGGRWTGHPFCSHAEPRFAGYALVILNKGVHCDLLRIRSFSAHVVRYV